MTDISVESENAVAELNAAIARVKEYDNEQE